MTWMVWWFALSLGLVSCVDWDVETDLDRYVHADDGYFSWEELTSYRYDNLSTTVYILNMTSQKWLDETQVSKSIWWHMVGIAIPDEIVDLERAWIFTEGGSNRDSTEPPPEDDAFSVLAATLSSTVGIIGGFVLQNPNQPIVFADDETQRSRSEDRLIAWTWRSYIENPNPNIDIVARLPMTKVHKRGMDTIYELAKAKVPETNINKFIVTGASKRGWTALSVAAVDQRVEMCIPIVFTLLNIQENMIRHNQALDGGWSFALQPYWDEDVTKHVYDPKASEIFAVEDMLYYKERLTMPKLFILATGDEFFFPQDLHTWWDDLLGPKYIMYNPNSQHILFPHYVKILETLTAVILAQVRTQDGASLTLFTDPIPDQLNVSRAETLERNTRRDFRLIEGFPDPNVHPVWWNWTQAEEMGPGVYNYFENNLENGEWLGFFLHGLWNSPDNYRIFLSTEVQITPDTFPRERCQQDPDCYGYLT